MGLFGIWPKIRKICLETDSLPRVSSCFNFPKQILQIFFLDFPQTYRVLRWRCTGKSDNIFFALGFTFRKDTTRYVLRLPKCHQEMLSKDLIGILEVEVVVSLVEGSFVWIDVRTSFRPPSQRQYSPMVSVDGTVVYPSLQMTRAHLADASCA
jgi:hypothetical protein